MGVIPLEGSCLFTYGHETGAFELLGCIYDTGMGLLLSDDM